MKTKIEKLSKIDTQNLDCKSPDYHEHFSTKSFDESKASVYFTPNEDQLSPQPLQMSPIHINYINEGMIGCESADFIDEARGPWRSISLRANPRPNQSTQRNSFNLPCDYLDEADEGLGNFIIPDPVYNDDALNYSLERFQNVIETPLSSMMSVSSSAADKSMRKRKKRYKEHRRSKHSIENETLLMHDMDVSKGARPKVYGFNNYKRQDCIGKTNNFDFGSLDLKINFLEEPDQPCCSSSLVKKVNSQVNIDEKTGKVVSTSTSTDCDLETNINGDEKMINQKFIKLQSSSSLPDLQSSQTSSSTPSSSATISSNSNNQMQAPGLSHGKHVILAVAAQDDEPMNQIDDATGCDGEHAMTKQKIKLNIAMNGSSSSTSSNNLEYGNGSASNHSTL